MNLASRGDQGYDGSQVLNTPQRAVPRADDAVFLCLKSFAPMRVGPVRKAGRTSLCVCSTTPTTALNSSEKVSKRSNHDR
jgi:hypothetical protein